MITQKLIDILAHEVDCAATIITSGAETPHVTNTWNSYIQIVDEETLYIPAGGMKKTEYNLTVHPEIKLSISNRVVQGFHYPGTGVIVEGTAQMTNDAKAVGKMREIFPWIRAVLEVKVKKVTQTQ